MKEITFSKVLSGLSALLMILFFTSCFSNTNVNSTQLYAYLQLKGATKLSGRADTTLVAGSDSLTFTNIRLIHGKSQFIRPSDTLAMSPQMLRFSSDAAPGNVQEGNVNVLARGSGANLPGTYQNLDFKIVQATDSLRENTSVADIFYDGGHYSVVIQGIYNHTDFTFKSKHNFDIPLSLQPAIDVPKNSTVVFIVYASVKDWFMNNGGNGFLDPADPSNISAINANIQNSFDIRTQGDN